MTATTTAGAAGVPASRDGDDQGPDRAARGEPRGHRDGVPVYGWGQAPPYLRTQTQLAAERLKLAQDQPPLAYLRTRKHGDVPLYDPGAAAQMRPLAASTRARMADRRTCPECDTVRDEIVRGSRCSVCRDRAEREKSRLRARTCAGCGTVRERPYPEHGHCRSCRQAQLEQKRARVAAWLEEVILCAGADCTVKLGTKSRAHAFLKSRPHLLRPEAPSLPDRYWHPGEWPRLCPACTETEEQRRTEQRARWQEEERARREAERAELRGIQEWAAAALADPDVVVLDTESTGLDASARIVELAVLSSAGDVLLDTLVNPGVPIPEDASALHGITDSAVAGAPAFADLLVQLTGVLDGKRVLIYNKWYDVGLLEHELTLHYAARDAAARTGTLPVDLEKQPTAADQAAAWLAAMRFEDVMTPYSRWVGEWSDYHGDYRWQPLAGGHRAAQDCHAVLNCLRDMARPGDEDTDMYETTAVN